MGNMSLKKLCTQVHMKYKLRYFLSKLHNFLSIFDKCSFLGQFDIHTRMWHIHQWSHNDYNVGRYRRIINRFGSDLCKLTGRNKICIYWCLEGHNFCNFGIRRIFLSIINSQLYTSHTNYSKCNEDT